ncbi:hypothetical protein [Humibacter ginsenosidimutans]|nr:hypothetical protein [Humibacter ginsenosidimutans]
MGFVVVLTRDLARAVMTNTSHQEAQPARAMVLAFDLDLPRLS